MKSISHLNSQSFDVKYRFLGPFWRLLAPSGKRSLTMLTIGGAACYSSRNCCKIGSILKSEATFCVFFWTIFKKDMRKHGLQSDFENVSLILQVWAKILFKFGFKDDFLLLSRVYRNITHACYDNHNNE